MKDKQRIIEDALFRVKMVINDINFQAACIDVSKDPSLSKEYKHVLKDAFRDTVITGLDDMWDVYDSDNWTSMVASLEEVKSVLEELQND